MKITKPLILIFCLFSSLSFYAQTKDSIKSISSKFYTHVGSSAIDQPLSLKKLNFQRSTPSLVLYNSTTNLYDIYLDGNGSYSYSGSNIRFRHKSNFLTTLFLGNDSFTESNTLLPNSTLLLDEDDTYRVRDSFNPHGASNISEALIGGVLGLLFN
ncbi:hypothetical protein LB465_15510 [Salegentibacter sp. LM13S]|uniref:hypothetical protein n=1 Tax=Salegentibacter lacus TaxID=2873599 RepID=UPI001CCB2361|nr:hypothetical protein [Salegentibacter lacus]MBZ9632189.1 hypothetical protein [Salegentibacter lacus]